MVRLAPVAVMLLTVRVAAMGLAAADSSDSAPSPEAFTARTLNL